MEIVNGIFNLKTSSAFFLFGPKSSIIIDTFGRVLGGGFSGKEISVFSLRLNISINLFGIFSLPNSSKKRNIHSTIRKRMSILGRLFIRDFIRLLFEGMFFVNCY